MCNFPNIPYNNSIPIIGNNNELPTSVSAMITILNRIGIHVNIDGINNMNMLEVKINELIAKIDDKSQKVNYFDIFHLIQIWGGKTGRNIYVMGDGFENNINFIDYFNFTNTCLDPTSTIHDLFNAAAEFNRHVRFMGISFITKHLKFWNTRAKGEDALPIYDIVMAKNIMLLNAPSFNTLLEYWECMINKANEETITLSALERQLFVHFH